MVKPRPRRARRQRRPGREPARHGALRQVVEAAVGKIAALIERKRREREGGDQA